MGLDKALKINYEKNLEEAKTLVKKWDVGDEVRVLKNLNENISNVKEFLGKVCVVEEVNIMVGLINRPKIEYILRLGDRLEPFWDYELDLRFKSRNKK